MLTFFASTRRRWLVSLAAFLTAMLVVPLVGVAPAAADTAPVDPALPPTVSSDALPTVQVSGVVWAQVIVGNRVYVTGEFSQARPAGAAPGTDETPRSNILAYDVQTGELITSWAPTLNAQGLAIAASADGSVIYVGGDFDQVNGQWRSRIAAINAQTGALIPGFGTGANTRVNALAVNGGTLYMGGYFTTVSNQTRTRLAAVDAATGALLPWAPTADREVVTMTVHAASGRVYVGGSFYELNGTQQYGMGSLDGVTGDVMPWAVNRVIQNRGEGSFISGLITDGDRVYGTGWAYFAAGALANFEGIFSAHALTGELDWVNGCRGDNYGIDVLGDVLYTVGHPHDCGMIDWNPQTNPWTWQRAAATHKHRSPYGLTNAFGTPSVWQPFRGMPAAEPLHWLPALTAGTYTGNFQAAYAVTSNDQYVVLAGEFPRVNGVNQQGLVRFAIRDIAPNRDVILGYSELQPSITPLGPGTVRIGWTAAYDRDNARLTYEVLRGPTVNTSTVLTTFQVDATWWARPPLGFVDTTAPPGSSQTYRIRVRDPFQNGFAGLPTTITIPANDPAASPYRQAVAADGPTHLWRLSDGGRAAYDWAGSSDLTLANSAQRNVAGALLNEGDRATTFPTSTNTSTVMGAPTYRQAGPQTFSLEAWVRTTTLLGGKIIGFGDSRTGRSGSDGNDRNLYMTNSGQIRFGVRPDMSTRVTITSSTGQNNNQWHHVVATLSSDGMRLYVDGELVSHNDDITKAQVFRGYWRVAGDRLSSWPTAPTAEAFAGTLDEVAVYPTALSLARVRAHYLASGRTGNFDNIPPSAAFSSNVQDLTVSFNGSASADPDGTLVSHEWDFGDGQSGSGATVQHTYAAAGTYTVTLTVTDDDGAPASKSNPVTVTDPPPNIPPSAAFSSNVQDLTVSFNGSASADPDGTLVSHEWDFGDGQSGSGATVQHTYAAAGSYTVTLTVTDDDGAPASKSNPVTVTDPPLEFGLDAFERTLSNGLGVADVGGPYTLSGPAASFSVAGGAGRVAGAVAANRAAYLNGVEETDIDMTVDLAIDTAASGGGAYVSVIGRRVSNGNDYRVRLRYMPNGEVIAYLARTLGGADTILSLTTVPGIVVAPGDVLRVRLEITGSTTTTVNAKVWRDGTPEPGSWLLTGNDATPAALQGPGGIGVLLYTSGSWVGTPATLAIDNLHAVRLS